MLANGSFRLYYFDFSCRLWCKTKSQSSTTLSTIIKIVSQWRPFSFILYNLYDKQLRLVSECVSFGVRSGSSWASFSVYSPRNRRVVRPWARTAGWWGCRHTHYSWSSGDRRASGSPRVKARGSPPWWSFCTCCKTSKIWEKKITKNEEKSRTYIVYLICKHLVQWLLNNAQ